MSPLLNPWSPTPRRISLAVRNGGNVIANEQQLAAMLANRTDPAVRARAIKHLNAVAAAATNELLTLSAPGNFPDNTTSGIPQAVVFGEMDRIVVDTRWRALYNVKDYRQQPGPPVFKIADVFDSLTFEIYELGERIRASRVRGTSELFEGQIAAASLEWNRFWATWEASWNTDDGLAAMNAKYLVKMAKLAIMVLTAAGISTTNYDTAGTNQLEKDVNTINAGALEIGNAVFTKTNPDGQQVEEDVEGRTMYLIYNPSIAGYKNRVNKALRARFDAPNDTMAVSETDIPVLPYPTRYAPVGGWFLVLPSDTNVAAIFRDLELYDFTDPRYAGVVDGKVGQGLYRMVRGDSRKVRKLLTS